MPLRLALACCALLLTAGCQRLPARLPAATAPQAPAPAPRWTSASIDWERLDPAALTGMRRAFQSTCPALTARRTDLVVSAAEWASLCAAAARASIDDRAFASLLTPVRLGDGQGLATGYFEPEIAASRTPAPGHAPVLGPPAGLVDLDLGRFLPDLAGRRLRARARHGAVEPLPDRAAIEAGALAAEGLELAWAADPVELFFLQIQGSGRLAMPDGEVWRIGYAGQNGHPYVALGRVLAERGLLPAERRGMEAIMAVLRAQPDGGAALMRENPSYVFFRRLQGPGPLGSLGVPLVPRHHAAVDPRHLPYGAPLLAELRLDGRPARLLLVAGDTGGAIRGPNRIDIFFGAGAQARRLAGDLAAPVEMTVLVPREAAERLVAGR